MTPDRSRVTGVRLQSPHDPEQEQVLEADLVVDTMGRGSRSPRWLTDLGYERVEEQRLTVDVHYVTLLFRRDPADLGGCQNVLVDIPPDATRGGVALAIEDGRWLGSSACSANDPHRLDGFVSMRSLSVPDLHDIVRAASQ